MNVLQKKTAHHLAILTFCLLCIPSAHADDTFYLGGKVGIMAQYVASPSGGSSYPTLAIFRGIIGGYNLLGEHAQFPVDMGGLTIALEGEITQSIIDPPFDFYEESWKTNTQALYAVFRYNFNDKYFVQARAGNVNYQTTGEISQSGQQTQTIKYSTSDAGYGISGGKNFKSGTLRLDLSNGSYKKDGSVAIGYLFRF